MHVIAWIGIAVPVFAVGAVGPFAVVTWIAVIAVAVLSCEGEEIGRMRIEPNRELLEKILPAIDELLAKQGVSPSDIDDVRVESNLPDGYSSRRVAETVASVFFNKVIDEKMVDGVINLFTNLYITMASDFASLQNGKVRYYAMYILAGVSVMSISLLIILGGK